ncbi:MAG: nucleotidyltransferase family protein [Bryobacteraceae bacterium]
MIAGIILAAGASSRMGRPKALLDYRGETFVGRLIRIFSSFCDPVIVVAGYHAEAIHDEVDGRARFVVNSDPSRGQLSSLQTALAAIPSRSRGFMFTPVDCPAAGPETLAAVVDAFRNRNPETMLVIPQHEGRHGHPVCAAAQLIDELLALPPEAQAREVVHRYRPATQFVDVNDPGILADIDDPDAYLQLTSQ